MHFEAELANDSLHELGSEISEDNLQYAANI